MTIKITHLTFLLLLFATIWMSYTGGYAAANLEGATGAPNAAGGGKETTCQQCHGSGGPNTLQTSTLIELVDTVSGNKISTYTPGKVYKARVVINKVSGNPTGYGFQIVSLIDATRADVKGWLNPGVNVNIVNLTSGQKRSYAEQPKRSATNIFEVDWKAPVVGSGKVTFYACGNGVNGNGSSGGDAASLATLALTEGTVSNQELAADLGMKIFPTQVSSALNYRVDLKDSGNHFLQVFDVNGRIKHQSNIVPGIGVSEGIVDVSSFSQGVYFVKISNGGLGQVSKFIKN